ncbi:transcriptional activator FtrB [Clostridium tepidiprofundi DSM 19306]|uniref:Transcriptional activator FtrB n=1 Tax=Clostridium tepidiprofundi DSM 19306 TaxID=1121338 RepID=A0A151ATI3_9CLOT|nr:Crp/Fnr family transcriptional regulator [Clostridium tepidiprofundi]KYH30946.1 transcriptional activator FtrB [Clostridium tepidiprofundi DSM 19306]
MYTKWLNALKKTNLFENIEDDELKRMLFCLKPKIMAYKRKEFITIAEDNFTGIGIVLQGEVIISKENALGDKAIMAKLEEGNVFGEMIAFSDRSKWHVTIIASKNCTVLFLPAEKIIGNCPRMCIGHKVLIQNMLKIVSQKALGLDRKIEYLTMKSIRNKISSYLLEQYNIKGKSKFSIPLKRNELAEFLNVSRPSLSRELIKMRKEGIIEFYKSSFEIIDLEKLKLGTVN